MPRAAPAIPRLLPFGAAPVWGEGGRAVPILVMPILLMSVWAFPGLPIVTGLRLDILAAAVPVIAISAAVRWLERRLVVTGRTPGRIEPG
jgi:hypothetical protein